MNHSHDARYPHRDIRVPERKMGKPAGRHKRSNPHGRQG